MSRRWLWGGAALALALAAGAAAAREAPVSELVVTASRSGEAERADLTGASITVLSPEDLRDRQVQVVSDVLRDVPGIAISRAGGVGGLTQARLRGSEANHVLVLIDGMEVSDPYQGEFDFGTLIADEAARIEVLRGQQSALYGSDAIGGVIDYVTLSGREAPGLSARAEAGSFGTAEAAARAAGVSGPLDVAVSGGWRHTDGTPTARDGVLDQGADIGAVSGKAALSLSPDVRIKAVGRYSYARADQDDSEMDPASPAFGLIVDTPGAYVLNRALYGLLRAETGQPGGRWTQAVSVQGADVGRDGYEAYGRASGDRGRRAKGSYETTFRFDTGPLSHALTGAVDAEREDYRNTDPTGFADTRRHHNDDLGLVGEYELRLGERLGLGAAVRHDDNDRFADTTTWRAQGSWLAGRGTRLHAAAGSGVKNPGFYDLYGYVDGRYIGDKDLKPERSRGWEAGAGQSVLGGRLVAGLTYFHSVLKDEIYTDYPPPAFVATPANRTTASTQHGIEATATARWRAFTLDGAYTWLRAREDGVEEVRRAPHIASLNLDWRPEGGRFGANLSVRYNGRQTDVTFTDPTYATTPTVILPSFTLVTLGADWRLNDRVQLSGRIENLLDRHYEEVFSFRAPGRATYAGVRAGF